MTPNIEVVTITLNPAIDQTVYVKGFHTGEVNRVNFMRQDAGGKGVNVASALADLGVGTLATGFLGTDNATIFENLFRGKSIRDRFVRLQGSTRVGVKIVDEISRQTTDINYPGLTPSPESLEQLISLLKTLVEPGRWFVISGSLPFGVTPEIYALMIREIRARGGRVLLDTSGEPLRGSLAAFPDVVKPNLSELGQAMESKLNTTDEAAEAAASLLEKGVGMVVVSMGSRGALFVREGEVLLAKPPAVSVQSSVGAGDTMVAGIIYAQCKQMDFISTARLATALGAYAVTRVGSGADWEQVRQLEEQVEVEELCAGKTAKASCDPGSRLRSKDGTEEVWPNS